MSLLLDAGPSLNFLAVGQQNVLIQLAAARGLTLAAPQQVDDELHRKATKDPRFAKTAALATWTKLTTAGRVTVLADTLADAAPAFTTAISRISGMPATERVEDGRSLGEIMVIAHASALAQQGMQVVVLIDDGDGRQKALAEQQFLLRHRASGELALLGTPQVLQHAGGQDGWIIKGKTWGQVYDEMRKFDDGLAPRP